MKRLSPLKLVAFAVLAIAGLLAVLVPLFAADTTYSTFNVQTQAYQSLRLKDNTDTTFSYQNWITGDGTHYLPAGDVPARAISMVPALPGTFVVGTSTGGAQANSPTLPATAAVTNYVSGFTITGLGATGASAIAITLSDGTNTLKYSYPVVAGVTAANATLSEKFNPPIPAVAVNTAWTLTVPSFGSGNTAATATVFGYQR